MGTPKNPENLRKFEFMDFEIFGQTCYSYAQVYSREKNHLTDGYSFTLCVVGVGGVAGCPGPTTGSSKKPPTEFSS